MWDTCESRLCFYLLIKKIEFNIIAKYVRVELEIDTIKKLSNFLESFAQFVRESNPCFRRERAAS